MQATIDFTTSSPINVERLKGQNKRLYEYLKSGGRIHCFHHSLHDLRIGYLNSCISDLVNSWHISIQKKWIKVIDPYGDVVDVVEYSM